MKITELLDPGHILPDMKAGDKRGALEELATILVPGADNLDFDKVMEVLLERERLGSTGIGDNIAFPHGKLSQLSRLVLAFGRSPKGVDFESMDGKPTHLFFLLLVPANSTGLHLKALAKISRMLKDAAFQDSLMKAAGAPEIFQLISGRDDDF
jgi:PTS system nitrogen regulatory IIA component